MRYCYEGSNGGYPIGDDKFDRQQDEELARIICDLCAEECTDTFKLKEITPTLSICLCPHCYNQDEVEYMSALEFINPKHRKS